jgi:LysM repeat protein
MSKMVAGVLIGVAVAVGGVLAYQAYREQQKKRATTTAPANAAQAQAQIGGPPTLSTPGPTAPGPAVPAPPGAPPPPSPAALLAQFKAASTDADRFALYDQLNQAHPKSAEANDVRQALIAVCRAAGDQYRLRNLLSDCLWKGLPDAREAELKREIAALNATLIFSTRESPDGELYAIKPGDALERIGRQYKISPEFIARINGIRDPKRIRFGDTLKVIQGPLDVLVEIEKFRLTILLHGRFVKEYKIGVGKDERTPLGTFEVKEKSVNPTWWGPEGEVIAADDPKNPLGERWIGIQGTVGQGYGIHGTIEPESIGTACSRGCIRMLEKDVDEVYDFVVPKLSRVTIVK